jgi:glycosyltransferase involved in cell wall biosynthesis
VIYLNFPVGAAHGWGVCGRYVARETARLTDMRLLTEPFTAGHIGDELEARQLTSLLPSADEARRLDLRNPFKLDAPLLQLASKQLEPMFHNLAGTPTVGYCFFEDTELRPEHIERGRRHFQRLATGSTWCSEILRRHGIENVATVLQGVDTANFFPRGDDARTFFRDKFVVFSGGKFEFRKGQDLVIRAYKALQDRHPRDVMLVASWFNQWAFSFRSMAQSPHITFAPTTDDLMNGPADVLRQNGVDMDRVVLVGPRQHSAMAQVYHNTDVGIFPNRAEGGTNLVLMEYMACGKPVIATASTGHADVVSEENALVIETRGEVTTSSDGESVARWPEPVLEQAVEQLEQAYQNRDAIKPLAARGAARMAAMPWSQTAQEFLELLTERT